MPVAEKCAVSKPDMWNWSTSDLVKEERFERFQAVNNQVQCLWDLTKGKEDEPFQASMEIAQVGDYALSNALTGPLTGFRKKTHIDADGQDFFSLMYQAEGAMVFRQGSNESYVCLNYIAFWDSAQPAVTRFDMPIRQLHLIIPRAAAVSWLPGIERLSGLAIDGNTQCGRILRSHLLQLAESPFDNGLSDSGLRDSSLGCGPERAVSGWLNMRSAPSVTRPI